MKVCVSGFEVVYAGDDNSYDQICIDHVNKRYISDVNIALGDYNSLDDIGFRATRVSVETLKVIENGLIDKGYVCLV